MHVFSSKRCFISDSWQYNGMKVVWLENDFIKIGVLVGRGADIFEFRYKPRNVNFLLRLPGKIKNPNKIFAQIRDTPNQMEDYYYGGWQEIVPNSQPFKYRGASLGQHGEIWGIPWNYSILDRSKQKVSVRCWTRPMRIPLLMEKTLHLESTSEKLTIRTSITNESPQPFDLMWGQHIAFGLPFLSEGAKVETNAVTMEAESEIAEPRCFKPGVEMEWPLAYTGEGEEMDARIIPEEHEQPYSDLAYLSGFGETGEYRITNKKNDVGFGLKWDASLYKYLWFWQERYGIQDAPWWGRTYAVALEPWTSKHTNSPEKAIKNGDWLQMKPHEKKETVIVAYPVDNEYLNH